MALSMARLSCLNRTCMKNWLTTKSQVFVAAPIQVATLKATYGEKYPYSKPWPYETKKLTFLRELFDVNSLERLNENSKVICVEGNIGVGKKDFAQKLAREYDLKYIPPVHDDAIFNRLYGYDERMVDDMVSEEAKCYDLKSFLSDPNPQRGTVGRLQTQYLREKFYSYARALLHLLSTGQGIVVVRSPHGDDVFTEAFRRLGWVTKPYSKYYYDIRNNSICEALKPHVTVFLDAPAETCMDRIMARRDPREFGGEKNLKELLPAIEAVYKQKWLKTQRSTHEVLEVDWTEIGDDMDMDVIAEEMEHLKLHCDDADDPMFKDWYCWGEDHIAGYRHFYGNQHEQSNFFFRHTPWDAPESFMSQDARLEREQLYTRHPAFASAKGTSRELGYNPTWQI